MRRWVTGAQRVSRCNYILHFGRVSRLDCESWGWRGRKDNSFLWSSNKWGFWQRPFPRTHRSKSQKQQQLCCWASRMNTERKKRHSHTSLNRKESPVKRWQQKYKGILLVLSRKSFRCPLLGNSNNNILHLSHIYYALDTVLSIFA